MPPELGEGALALRGDDAEEWLKGERGQECPRYGGRGGALTTAGGLGDFVFVESILAKALGHDPSQLAAAEKQHLLTRLLARLAHEIRNPLSSLDIHVQLLEEDVEKLAPQLLESFLPRFEIIHGELHRLENIVRHFVRLASPSELNLEEVDLEKIARHVCDLLRPEAAVRKIELMANVIGTVPLLRADPVQLTQALINLVINALQAVESQGRVDLEVSSSEGWATFVVRDSGPGVPVERSATIFEPYFTTRPDGSGLGLWIVQQVATAHGGTVQASNGSGGGAVFTFKLPMQRSEAQQGPGGG